MTFTDSESDSEDEESSEFCGSGEWAGRGVSDTLLEFYPESRVHVVLSR